MLSLPTTTPVTKFILLSIFILLAINFDRPNPLYLSLSDFQNLMPYIGQNNCVASSTSTAINASIAVQQKIRNMGFGGFKRTALR